MKKSKLEISVSLNQELLLYIKSNYTNRSKFIEYCIIQELSKNDFYKKELEKINLL